METGLTKEEIHLLLKDMADVCLRPPENEAWRFEHPVAQDFPQERKSLVGQLCRRLDAMRPWSAVLLAAVLLAPLVALTLQVALFGPLPSLIFMTASALAGAWLLLRQGPRAFRSLFEGLAGLVMGRSVPLPAMQRALRVGCAILLLLPDPLSSSLAVVFLMPDVHLACARWLQRQTSPVFTLS